MEGRKWSGYETIIHWNKRLGYKMFWRASSTFTREFNTAPWLANLYSSFNTISLPNTVYPGVHNEQKRKTFLFIMRSWYTTLAVTGSGFMLRGSLVIDYLWSRSQPTSGCHFAIADVSFPAAHLLGGWERD